MLILRTDIRVLAVDVDLVEPISTPAQLWFGSGHIFCHAVFRLPVLRLDPVLVNPSQFLFRAVIMPRLPLFPVLSPLPIGLSLLIDIGGVVELSHPAELGQLRLGLLVADLAADLASFVIDHLDQLMNLILVHCLPVHYGSGCFLGIISCVWLFIADFYLFEELVQIVTVFH